MKQKLVIFDMSRSHWHDEEKILWHDDCLYVSIEFYKRNVAHARQFLIEHLMWNAFWNQYENIVNRIKQTRWFIEHRTRFEHAKSDHKLRDISSYVKTSRQNLSMWTRIEKCYEIKNCEIYRSFVKTSRQNFILFV